MRAPLPSFEAAAPKQYFNLAQSAFGVLTPGARHISYPQEKPLTRSSPNLCFCVFEDEDEDTDEDEDEHEHEHENEMMGLLFLVLLISLFTAVCLPSILPMS